MDDSKRSTIESHKMKDEAYNLIWGDYVQQLPMAKWEESFQ